jgi:chromosome segregation protein
MRESDVSFETPLWVHVFPSGSRVSYVYLKEIQMENFKSFKGKMNLPLIDGYTGITGPNGCGKSNISDAVLFVLGPRSSKAIRAGRLTDLIFNGGKGGSPAQFCKVSLLFDNTDRILPVENSLVKLTRYVKRTRSAKADYVSYFYVNDRKSALNDFDAILSHAKISAEGYNLVQQGDITRIVEMGPKERRGILDDIAGISRFDGDIESAEKDKVATEENLERIGIILEELRKQLKQLESDRVHALKYREQKEKLELAKVQLEYKRKESLENEIAGLTEQIKKRDDEINSGEKDKAKLRDKLADIEKELANAEKEIEDKSSAEASELRKNLDALKIEIARCTDSRDNSEENIAEQKALKKTRKGDLDKLVKELEGLKANRNEVKNKHRTAKKALEAARKEYEEAEKKLASSGEGASPMQKEALELKKRIDGVAGKVREASLERDRLDDKIQRLETELEGWEERHKGLEFQLKDTEWRLKELKSEGKKSGKNLKDLQSKFQAKRKEEEELSRQSMELEAAINSLTRDYNRLKAEQDAHKSVQQGYDAAVSSVLEARDKGELKGIRGSIAELVTVDRKFETAITTAAGKRMQAVVVEDDAAAENAIRFLKKNRIGRAMFLPLNKMLPSRPRGKALLAVKGSEGFAIDLVKHDDEYKDALSYVLGDTVVVKNLEEARERMGGVRLVTLEGELVEASGAMIGGVKEQSLIQLGTVERGQLDLVGDKLRKATQEADKLTEKLAKIHEDVLDLEGQLRDAGVTDTSGTAELDALEARKKELKDEISKTQKTMDGAGAETNKSQGLKEKVEADLEKWEKKLAALDAQRHEKEKDIISLASTGVGKAMRELQSNINKLTGEEAGLAGELGALEGKIDILEERLSEVEAAVKEIEKRIATEEKNIKVKTKELIELETKLKAMEKIEEGMDKELSKIREKRDGAFKLKTATEAEIDKLASKIEAKNDFLRGLKIELESASKRLAEVEEAVKELKLDDKKKLPSTETLEKTIKVAEAAIESLGAVNMRALDSYDELVGRHGELNEELKKLRDQRRRLMKLVEELNEKKKQGLLKVFEAVNEKFKDVYAELSDGGEAELLLENPDDPFSAGLLINARPPGKKVHRLESLSGGEKGLVSMALIFAIQRYDPSPFYLLDEVDQNLDAVNAENVAKMVKRNAENAQFLQISLRKVTLKEAQNLVGVTMQRKGISDIVMKVDLGDVKEPPANGPTPKGAG